MIFSLAWQALATATCCIAPLVLLAFFVGYNWREVTYEYGSPIKYVLMDAPVGACPMVPTRAKQGDLGYDLYLSEDITLPPLSFRDGQTHVKVQFPPGYGGRITGRSSTVRKWKVQVQEGIIDEGFRDQLFVGMWNLNNEPITISKGTRVAQLIPMRRHNFRWVQTSKLAPSERGTSGFGSTGA